MKNFIVLIAIVLLGATLSAGTVQGMVIDASTGLPIENAKVHFTSFGSHVSYDVYTDVSGSYSIVIPARTYNVRALKNKEYRVALIENIEVGGEEDIVILPDFELEPTDGAHNNFRKQLRVQLNN